MTALKSLLDDPQRLADMSRKTRALSHPSTPLIAEGILARCREIFQQRKRFGGEGYMPSGQVSTPERLILRAALGCLETDTIQKGFQRRFG